MATLDTKSIDPFAFNVNQGFDMDKETEILEKLQAESNALPDPRKVKYIDELHACIKGRLINFPIADGRAWYKVTSVKPLKLLHLHFCDGYSISPITLRGLRLIDVANMVARELKWEEAVAKSRAERLQKI